MKLILLLGLLSILDGVLTWAEVPHGITEVNPVMAAVLPFGLLGVVAVKGIPVGFLGLLARTGKVKVIVVKALTAVYGVVLAWHAVVLMVIT